jgi:hypothetical protein
MKFGFEKSIVSEACANVQIHSILIIDQMNKFDFDEAILL